MPLVIPKQPELKWFDALANSTIATPLETLEWLHMPDSPSLGKRTYDLEAGPTSLVYKPGEYDTLSGPDSPMTKLTDLSGLNRQGDPEDHETKKAQI